MFQLDKSRNLLLGDLQSSFFYEGKMFEEVILELERETSVSVIQLSKHIQGGETVSRWLQQHFQAAVYVKVSFRVALALASAVTEKAFAKVRSFCWGLRWL